MLYGRGSAAPGCSLMLHGGKSGFWIQNGEISFPVSEVTIAGNMLNMYRIILTLFCTFIFFLSLVLLFWISAIFLNLNEVLVNK